ncbi:hypothetical protein [Ensifer sp. ZNC0028]|uniref:hypothetical protein n=1 Tax=Ensifer sp. ZNC0028 TaxID=1339236 RepID=UPI00068FDF0E|nr:hypothetical protein [Ensifer sp. ZNC0028]
MHVIETNSAKLTFNPQGGHLEEVAFGSRADRIRPMHRAPWRTGEDNGGRPERVPAAMGQSLASLSGDFFCAPFGHDDVSGTVEHGLTANGVWLEESFQTDADGTVTAIFRLDGQVAGAAVFKELTLKPDQPIVYQRHRFVGGFGMLPVAHHPMVRITGEASLNFSPKAFGATPEHAVETDPQRGNSALMYPQEFVDLTSVRLKGGGAVDLSVQPGPPDSEDFLILAEEPNSTMGWTAVSARDDGFLFFSVRDPRVLPFSMLWMSNGGRHYEPFSGRHRGVLGLEEGCTFFGYGREASSRPNWLNERGYPTAIELVPDGEVAIGFAFGAIRLPDGWRAVSDIGVSRENLIISSDTEATVELPFWMDGVFSR